MGGENLVSGVSGVSAEELADLFGDEPEKMEPPGFHARKRGTPRTQAERVVAKFGNARRLAHFLHLVNPDKSFTPSAIYRWSYPRDKGGRGGVIPPWHLETVMAAARLAGIVLTQEDISPLATKESA